MKKRFVMFAIVLFTFLLFLAVSAVSEEVEPAPVSDFVYVSNGEVVQINAYKGPGGVVRIPDMIDGLPVTRIAANAFLRQNDITGVIFPSELEYIGESAFAGCGISSVLVFPSKLKEVSFFAFTSCSRIPGVIITSDCIFDGATFVSSSRMEFIYIVEGCSVSLGSNVFSIQEPAEAIIPASVVVDPKSFDDANQLIIYTPDGSEMAKIAKDNFIQVNTKDYELKKAEYENKYSYLSSASSVTATETTADESEASLEKNEQEETQEAKGSIDLGSIVLSDYELDDLITLRDRIDEHVKQVAPEKAKEMEKVPETNSGRLFCKKQSVWDDVQGSVSVFLTGYELNRNVLYIDLRIANETDQEVFLWPFYVYINGGKGIEINGQM